MTKKDFIAIANGLKNIDINNNSTPDERALFNTITNELCHVFSHSNDKFDEARFKEYIASDKRFKDYTDK